MVTIGRIKHKEPLLNHKQVSYLNYGANEIIDSTLPTLIVGWKFVNELFPTYNHDILERQIFLPGFDSLYWEFSPTEDIVQYNGGIEHFLKKVPYRFITFFTYKNADPFNNNLLTLQNVVNYLPEGGNLYIYKDETAYYIKDNNIYGFKLSVYGFLGIKINEIIEVFIKKSNRYLIDSEATEYQKYYKLLPEFGHLKRSMVVFLFS